VSVLTDWENAAHGRIKSAATTAVTYWIRIMETPFRKTGHVMHAVLLLTTGCDTGYMTVCVRRHVYIVNLIARKSVLCT